MKPSEFDLIRRYFTKEVSPKIDLGVGDDCALFGLPEGEKLAVSTDLLISGTHFFEDTDPYELGHKSLAVNLSDLAAMGAKPIACTLAVSLPKVNEPWIKAFSEGFLNLAKEHHCDLIGGDTTKGPLSICVTVFGSVPFKAALRRDAAQIGDDIWVSGYLGEARAGLEFLQGNVTLSNEKDAISRLQKPTPRVALGLALRGIAHAALDLSDGLVGDLGHILERSNKGATLFIENLPQSPILATLDEAKRLEFILAGGDDYELCFTAPTQNRDKILKAAKDVGVQVFLIGTIEKEGFRLLEGGQEKAFLGHSFDHFLS